jgi:hypothetical protein
MSIRVTFPEDPEFYALIAEALRATGQRATKTRIRNEMAHAWKAYGMSVMVDYGQYIEEHFGVPSEW